MTLKEIIDILDELKNINRTNDLFDNGIIISAGLCDEIINALYPMYEMERQEKNS
jgi:hypothetical protein